MSTSRAQGSDGEEGGGRVILRDEPMTVDLLTLQNEVLDLVDEVEVPSGSYSQLRLVISDGFIEVEREGGTTEVYASSEAYAAAQGVTADGELQMPSFDSSGLKIRLPEGATEVVGDQHVLLIDFDVAESFGQQAGQSGRWVLRPVIRATDFGLTGSANLDLRLGPDLELPAEVLSLADFTASLDKGGDVIEVAFEDVDGDGTFTAPFLYLAPGSYTLDLAGPGGITFETDAALPLMLTVESGRPARETVTLLSVTGG